MSEETKEPRIFGTANDGTQFDADSPEVKAFQEEFPDTNLDVAIGSVVMAHNRKSLEEASEATEDEKEA